MANRTPEDRVIELDGVTRRYGGHTAIKDISLDVRRGEMFGLIGPGGAGKTTALRVTLGLLHTDGGAVRVFGLDPRAHRQELASRAGYLPQRFSLYGDLSVEENLGFFAEVHGVRGWRERGNQLLERVRLAEFRRRLADRLSGGMKQKLALACTLIHTPDLLVLDEPTTGVDPVSRREFWTLLGDLQREGLTLFLTTPYLDEAERCDRVALMDRGEVLALDRPGALRATFPGTLVEVLAEPRREARRMLERLPGVSDIEIFGERLHVHLAGVPPADAPREASRLAEALRAASITVSLARPAEPILEDIFIARIRDRRGAARETPEVKS